MLYPAMSELLKNVDSRYLLVNVVAHRARQLANGATPLVESDKDKPTVLALREMAAGKVGLEVLNRGQG